MNNLKLINNVKKTNDLLTFKELKAHQSKLIGELERQQLVKG